MDEATPPSHEFSRVAPRVGLVLILLASLSGVIWAVVCIYHLVHYTLGLSLAEVVVAFLMILILRLICVGIQVGLHTKQALRQRSDHARRIYYLCQKSRTLQQFWWYLGWDMQTVTFPNEVSIQRPSHQLMDSTVDMQLPQAAHDGVESEIAKRGRPPDYSIDRWAKVVAAWEHRNPWHDPITLDEFLCREFGECPDGSPRVSRRTFYDWRKKCIRACPKQLLHSQSLPMPFIHQQIPTDDWSTTTPALILS